MKSFLMYCLAAGLGALIYSGMSADAHPPCNDYSQPVCRYVQVVNPITGQLEQQYVCH